MRELHIVIGNNGGTGNTSISSILAQVLEAKIVSTNPFVDEFSKCGIPYVPLKNFKIKESLLLHPESTIQLLFEDIFTYFQENEGEIVIDVSTGLTIPFLYFAKSVFLSRICESFQEGEIRLFVHGIVGGVYPINATSIISNIDVLSVGENGKKIIWLNNFLVKEEQHLLNEEVVSIKEATIIKTPLIQEMNRKSIEEILFINGVNINDVQNETEISVIKRSVLNIYIEFFKKAIDKITPKKIQEKQIKGFTVNKETKKEEKTIVDKMEEDNDSPVCSIARKIETKCIDGEYEPLSFSEKKFLKQEGEEGIIKVIYEIKKDPSSMEQEIPNQEIRDFIKEEVIEETQPKPDDIVFYGDNEEYTDEPKEEE